MNWLTSGYLLLIGILVIVFIFKHYIQRWLGLFAYGLFFLSLVGALVALVSVKPFVFLAEHSLQQAGTLETIRNIDEALPIDQVITPVKDLWEKIKEMWNGTPELEKPQAQPTMGEGVGMLEAEVYPQLVMTVAKSYRTAIMGVSILGLILSIYLSYTVAQTGELERLRKRVEKLEGRN